MKRDDDKCRNDGCDEPQFEDWYYCEHHANLIATINGFLGSVLAGR